MQSTRINEFLSVTGQISQADIAEIAKSGFHTIINHRPDNEEPGQLDHETAAAAAKKQGLDYHYQPVTTGTITRAQVADFEKLLLRSPQPILAHCRSGTRCYLMYALTRTLFENESPLKLVAEAAAKGYDIRALPMLTERLEAQK